MNKKSLKTLEYDKIITLLSSYAHSPLGKSICESLLPVSDIEQIVAVQTETEDACARVRMKGSTRFNAVRDIGSSLKLLSIDSSLSIQELWNIKLLLENVGRVRSYGVHEDDEAPHDSLDKYFAVLDPMPLVCRELSKCIESEDSVSDIASPTLNKIRKKQKNILSRVHGELNASLNAHREYLMDAVITMRNGSYCLPIKSEYKHKVAGIIHDQSSTGSTVFIEPMAIIRMNNELRELEIEENKEIEIILARLSSDMVPYISTLSTNVTTMAHLDFIYAKAELAKHMKANKPIFNTEGRIHIKEGRHPLLDPDTVVPIDISLGDNFNLLIITGPNTGGKTVSLKTVGLLTLMGQSGLHIPALDNSELSVYNEVFADIGDEQSIEQNLSTFSGHMKNIVHILDRATPHSLCLFDELGAGTDPTEGAALAIAILSFLHKMKVSTLATTHYSELKIFALNSEGVENASCEFDIASLKPTYRILVGVPGKSNAFAISGRLGLPDFIIEEAKTHISEQEASFEDLLSRLEHDRVAIEKEKLEVSRYKREIETLKKHYAAKEKQLEEKCDTIINSAKEEAALILDAAKETADSTIKNINKIASGAGLGSSLEIEREKLRSSLKSIEIKPAARKKKPRTSVSQKEPAIGDAVFVHSMGVPAVVSSLPNNKGMLFVQMGALRSQVHIKDLELIERDSNTENISINKPVPNKTYKSSMVKAASISPEVNVIGKNVDEACAILDKYLDDALLARLTKVRIIHGRGTGALQKGIHAYLKKQGFIKRFNLADFEDGGTAITIVEF